MSTIRISCSKCGKKLATFEERTHKFGSPIKQCKGCGSRYADPRFHEIAVDGVPADTFQVSAYVIAILLGGLISWRAYVLFGSRQLGVPDEIQWLLPCTFMGIGIFLCIYSIYEIIMIKSGLKEKKIEKLRMESEARLQDKSYAYLLKDMGYSVPDRYL